MVGRVKQLASSTDAAVRHRWQVLAVTAVAVFMSFLDVTIVNIAFPNLRADFATTSLPVLSWVINGYGVVFPDQGHPVGLPGSAPDGSAAPRCCGCPSPRQPTARTRSWTPRPAAPPLSAQQPNRSARSPAPSVARKGLAPPPGRPRPTPAPPSASYAKRRTTGHSNRCPTPPAPPTQRSHPTQCPTLTRQPHIQRDARWSAGGQAASRGGAARAGRCTRKGSAR